MGGRSVSAGMQTELDKRITRLGYLLQINASQTLRWSNRGAVTYNGVPWIPVDFELEGLQFRPDADPKASLKVQNLDDTVGALFLTEPMADATIDVYQFTPNALTAGDAVYLVKMVFDKVTIGLDSLAAQLAAFSSVYQFSPRRRVDAYNGFKFALPPGTVLAWGNEQFVLKGEDSNG